MLGRALALLLCSAVLAAPTAPAATAEPDRPKRAARAEAALAQVEAVLDRAGRRQRDDGAARPGAR